MNIQIETVTDSVRGCGWRKPGGLYLRSEGVMSGCGKLPVPLTVCPCCHAGLKPARNWTWFTPGPFLAQNPCRKLVETGQPENPCCFCPCGDLAPARAGLLWVGEKFYPTPADWLKEVARLGVSRRVNTIPKGFKLGEHWAFVAHRKAIATHPDNHEAETVYTPAIFHAFRPTRVEYVTKGNETEGQLAALVERGITPVKVIRNTEGAKP